MSFNDFAADDIDAMLKKAESAAVLEDEGFGKKASGTEHGTRGSGTNTTRVEQRSTVGFSGPPAPPSDLVAGVKENSVTVANSTPVLSDDTGGDEKHLAGSVVSIPAKIGVKDVEKIVRIVDAYRKLSEEEKVVATQFIYGSGDIDVSDEIGLVVQVLSCDPILGLTMKNLREIMSVKERVTRVFYILRLPKEQLHALGELVAMVSSTVLEDSVDDVSFSEKLEGMLNGLDSNIVRLVSATESVLAPALELEG